MLAVKDNKQIKRAYMPGDTVPEAYRHAVVLFQAEHDETYSRLDINGGKFRRGPNEIRTIGDHVLFRDCRHYFHMSVCKTVHIMRSEDAAEIERLDHEIAQLMEQRQAVLDESFKRGRALHQRDIDPNWDGNQ